MPVFALTIFCSAFLLFLVQPLIGRFLLPWFGGSPGVWTTCLLFFQTVLLAGYAYAHFVATRLTPRRQAIVHAAVLLLALAWLPLAPDAGGAADPTAEPVGRILLLLAGSVGLPYLALAATGPLLQNWFGLAHPAASPYRLYALSNAGSLLALLGYPFVVEPWLGRHAQTLAWSAGLVVFVLLGVACAWRVHKVATVVAATPDTEDAEPAPSVSTRAFWIVLPALASLLLNATTSKVCTDVAVIPFLWIAPLALYLLSFIICFDHPRWYRPGLFAGLFTVGAAVTAWLMAEGSARSLFLQLAGYGTGLFAACMIAHGEVHRLRPGRRHLTSFYLHLAAGGALGGLFTGLLAPRLFPDYWEFPLGLWLLAYLVAVLALLQRRREVVTGSAVGIGLAALILPLLGLAHEESLGEWLAAAGESTLAFHADHWMWEAPLALILFTSLRPSWTSAPGAWHARQGALPLTLAAVLGAVLFMQVRDDQIAVREAQRNFYGAHKIRAHGENGELGRYNLLLHGATTHGLQLLTPDYRRWPTSYYGAESGVGRALEQFPAEKGPRHIGVVGLGVGTMAAYGAAGDRIRFYEINPAIESVARRHFTYLADTPAQVTVVPGDARLTLAAELDRGEPQGFDVLVLDAFSSDAIPVHLLTREAFALYTRHLKPGGIIAVHISNRHLDLRPVLEAHARHYALHQATLSDYPDKETAWWLYRSTWTLLSPSEAVLAAPAIQDQAAWPAEDNAPLIEWTDDYASLLGVFR